MDTLTVESVGRGVYIVRYNGLASDPIPFWRVEYWKRKLMDAYHSENGRGR